MKQKQTLTVTKLLARLSLALDKIDRLDSILKERHRAAFNVSFYHTDDLTLCATLWSDSNNYEKLPERYKCRYVYEITSRGISFIYYEEPDPIIKYKSVREWSMSLRSEESMRLINVPNIPPPNYKGSMYTFHQEKIREALSALPAWAIVCMNPC